MPRVYVDFAGLQQIGDDCKTIASNIDITRNALQTTVNQLDWDIKFEVDINNIAKRLGSKMEACMTALKSYQVYITEAVKEYQKLNNQEAIPFSNGVMTKKEFVKWAVENSKSGAIVGLREGDPLYDKVLKGGIELDETLAMALPNSNELLAQELIGMGIYGQEWGGNHSIKIMEKNIERILSSYLDQGMIMKMNQYAEERMGDYKEAAGILHQLKNVEADVAKEILEQKLDPKVFKNSGLDDFFKAYEKIGKVIDWGKFSVEQITKFLADYDSSMQVLKSLKDVVGNSTASTMAIDNLIDRYNCTVFSIVEDTGIKITETMIDTLANAAGVPLQAGLQLGYMVTGMDSYGDNVAALLAMQAQHNEIHAGYVELQTKCINACVNGTEVSPEDYLKLETTFNYLKNSKIQQYEILKDLAVANSDAVQRYLRGGAFALFGDAVDSNVVQQIEQEIEKLKNYNFGETYPQ